MSYLACAISLLDATNWQKQFTFTGAQTPVNNSGFIVASKDILMFFVFAATSTNFSAIIL